MLASNRVCVLKHLSHSGFPSHGFSWEGDSLCESNLGSSNPVLRELNPSGFLAPSIRLLSRHLFVLVLAGTLSEFGFGCGFEAPGPGKLVGRVIPSLASEP